MFQQNGEKREIKQMNFKVFNGWVNSKKYIDGNKTGIVRGFRNPKFKRILL